ncbi:c-type cytochrome [Kalamiella sp. sgz302252]|uniref:c-type cytochrome n=1 Tax=Pantoea sp. sgz302252 TaxID=3341827 RepID=UPI0036D3D79C
MRRFSLPLAISLVTGIVSAAAQPQDNADIIAKGKYLAQAADCGACHTSTQQGAPMAGGYAIHSPLGNIYASNITPSVRYGIGEYSEEEFGRAVREGIDKQGRHLYPAMPYTAYNKITDEDVHALYYYFMHGVAPVEQAAPETHLPFPFSIRASMAVWNLLYAENKTFVPDPHKSPEVNRGDYLVNALAHCDTCHTPRNFLLAQNNARAFSGSSLGSWYAPNITPDLQSGIGSWSSDELARYLKTGHIAKAQAAGPMAEAVEHGLAHLKETDIQAITAYLRQVPAVNSGDSRSRDSYGQASSDEQRLRGQKSQNDEGWQIFSGSCANCHQPQGQGNGRYPSLFHNSATGADRPDNLVSAILFGVRRDEVAMPAFGPDADFTDRLSDQQIADVSNYVLKNFGNSSVVVTAERVKELRQGGDTPLLVKLTRPAVLTGSALVILFIVTGFALLRRKRRDHAAN